MLADNAEKLEELWQDVRAAYKSCVNCHCYLPDTSAALHMTNPSTRRAAVHHPSLSSPLVRVSSQQHLSFNPHSLTFSPSSPSIFLRQALMAASKRFTSRVWAEFVNNAGHDANCFGHLKVRRRFPPPPPFSSSARVLMRAEGG